MTAHRFFSAVAAAAHRDLGRDVPPGTTVVPSAQREGSTTAVAHPLADRTVIWCAHEIAPRIETLNRPDALTVEEFIAAAELLGGTDAGSGNNRVLTTEPAVLSHNRYRPVELHRDDRRDRELIEAFIGACSADDLDEAELDIDDLDPAIVAVVDRTGSIASYASGRLWALDADFDDIGVITHPHHRGQRLGSVAVSEYARRRQRAGRMLFYNCNVDNLGSNRVAETVGFELMNTVAAVAFD